MSRTVVRVSVFLVAISLALAATRAFSDDPPKKPADDDPFGEHATPKAPSPFDDEDPVPSKKPAKVVSSTAKPPAAKQAPSSDGKPKPKSKSAPKLHGGEKAILKALKQRTELDFSETPLKDVLDSLSAKHHIPIILDAAGLKDAGVEPDTPFSRKLSGISLQSALEIMLDDVGLKWTIHHEVLLITSPAKAESDEFMETKVYDVTDLVMPVPDTSIHDNPLSTPDAPVLANSIQGTLGMGMGGMGAGAANGQLPGGGFFNIGVPVHNRPNPPYTSTGADFTALMDLIQNTISTKSWIDNGGNGTMSDRPGQYLVISQTQEVHREIENLLADLRARDRKAPAFQVELHWLWLDSAHRDLLFASGGKRSANRSHTAIDRQRFPQIAREVPSFHAFAKCLNGQNVAAAAGDRRALIVGAIPMIDGGTTYQPVVTMPNVGVTAAIQPILLPGTKTARLTVKSTITRWTPARPPAIIGAAWASGKHANVSATQPEVNVPPQAPANPAAPASGASPPAAANAIKISSATAHASSSSHGGGSASCPIDLPVMPTQEFGTTLRVPLGKPVVVGSITFAPAGDAGVGAAKENPVEVYLIATTSVVKPAKKK